MIHILNGDSLSDQFPLDLPGKTFVFRDCLIEGPKKVVNLMPFLLLGRLICLKLMTPLSRSDTPLSYPFR